MELDRTLIDKESALIPEEIKAYHEKNDITVAVRYTISRK